MMLHCDSWSLYSNLGVSD